MILPNTRFFSTHGLPDLPRCITPRWEPDHANTDIVSVLAEAYADSDMSPGEGSLVVLNHERPVEENSPRPYLELLAGVRESFPELRTSFFARPPWSKPTWWKFPQANENWQALNNDMRSLVRRVDFLAPSLYTFETDINVWKEFAVAQVEECRRIGPDKEIYGFIWPKYHQYLEIRDQIPRGTDLPEPMWRAQLDFAQLFLDGCVLWGHTVNDSLWPVTREALGLTA